LKYSYKDDRAKLLGRDRQDKKGQHHKLWLEKFRVTIRENLSTRRVEQQLSRPQRVSSQAFAVFKICETKTQLTTQMLAKLSLSAGVWTKEI